MIASEILLKAVHAGIIDIGTIQQELDMNERKKYLEGHVYSVWTDSAGRWNTHLPTDDGKRRLVRKKNKKDIEDAIVAHYKAREEAHTVDSIFYQWISKKLEYGEIKRQTADVYKNVYESLVKDAIGHRKIEYLTEADLENYVKATIHDKQLTNKAYANLRIIIKGIFKHAKREGYTQLSVTHFFGDMEISRNIFKRTDKEDKTQVFTDKEEKKIAEYITEHDTLISLGVLLAFQTGLRAGELSALKPQDLTGHVLSVHRTEEHYKNGKHIEYQVRDFTKGRDGHREIVLTDSAVQTINKIKALNPSGEFLFENDGRRVKSTAFSNRLYDICDKVQIPRRSLHKCRKTYATKLIDAGVGEKLIMRQMGHTSIETTKNYYYFLNKDTTEIEKIITAAIG